MCFRLVFIELFRAKVYMVLALYYTFSGIGFRVLNVLS